MTESVRKERSPGIKLLFASLIGLATGPYRVQQAGWESTSRQVIDLAAALTGRLGVARR